MLTENDRLNALFVIQIVGVSIVFVSVLHLRLKPFTSITPGTLMTRMLLTVAVVLVLTLFLTLLKAGMISSLWKLITGKTTPSTLLKLGTFRWAISLCAVMDLLGLAVLIHATGGSRPTMYVPYLFTIVLLIIMLDAPLETIITCFVLTVIIFWGRLFYYNTDFKVTEGKQWIYNLYFGGITSLCVIFPTLVMVIDRCRKVKS